MPKHEELIKELERAAAGSGECCGPGTTAHLLRRAAIALSEQDLPANGVGVEQVPYMIIRELFNSIAAGPSGGHIPPAKQMPPARRVRIARLWKEDPSRRSIEWWTNYFNQIAASDFLMGRSANGNGHENWRPNFDWFLNATNMAKVLEGNYQNRTARINFEGMY